MSRQTIETGMMLAKSAKENDRVFIRASFSPPWWAVWRRRVVTCVMTPGQARTVAEGLRIAVHKLDVKRKLSR